MNYKEVATTRDSYQIVRYANDPRAELGVRCPHAPYGVVCRWVTVNNCDDVEAVADILKLTLSTMRQTPCIDTEAGQTMDDHPSTSQKCDDLTQRSSNPAWQTQLTDYLS